MLSTLRFASQFRVAHGSCEATATGRVGAALLPVHSNPRCQELCDSTKSPKFDANEQDLPRPPEYPTTIAFILKPRVCRPLFWVLRFVKRPSGARPAAFYMGVSKHQGP